MKFTEKFISGLKNFSSISNEINFVEGDVQTVIAAQGGLFASMKSDVYIDKSFAVGNLSKFLGILSIFNDPDVTIEDKYIRISSGDRSVNYLRTNPEFIKYEKNPAKFDKMTADVSFSLPYEKLSYILKSAALLDLDEVAFQIEGGYVTLYAEKENLQGSLATVNLGLSENVSEKIKVVVKKDRLKFFNSDYEVDISLKGAIRFRSDFITYIIAVEKNKSVGLK